mmetsp:Transcript_63308/g.100554  ORF Transcript_63308/g.100554 Transcript_63308/m.100554 type:complete len:225 (+) Transcript_63308:1221-1895(+)
MGILQEEPHDLLDRFGGARQLHPEAQQGRELLLRGSIRKIRTNELLASRQQLQSQRGGRKLRHQGQDLSDGVLFKGANGGLHVLIWIQHGRTRQRATRHGTLGLAAQPAFDVAALVGVPVLCHDGIPHELSGDGTAELRGIPGQALDQWRVGFFPSALLLRILQSFEHLPGGGVPDFGNHIDGNALTTETPDPFQILWPNSCPGTSRRSTLRWVERRGRRRRRH